MARQEYRDFSEVDFDDTPPKAPERKKSLEQPNIEPQAAGGNFFDTLDWNDGIALIYHYNSSFTSFILLMLRTLADII